ncbi:hypothetical protein PRIPAC_77160 [Pristionchus pacificus]|nr:hypothetical protein PRIPAC_77160 [Pristionchus pacificus]|eukprot:PDM69905.1 hypothetical protein PRIPAC_49117 [Pristionchus pacificus]
MRLLICLALMATASIAFEHEELFKENESLDSVVEKKAYFAFKLKDAKLERRVMLAQELAKATQRTIRGTVSIVDGDIETMVTQDKLVPDITSSFAPTSALELKMGGFYYDEAEHGARMNATFAEISKALCSSYPRHLTFDRFALDIGTIRGHLQNSNLGTEPISRILIENGFTYRPVYDIVGGDKSGFVVVRNNGAYKVSVTERGKVTTSTLIHPAAKVFLQKPLRTSVYVDTLSMCRESIFGTCEEVASFKLESCKKAITTITGL